MTEINRIHGLMTAGRFAEALKATEQLPTHRQNQIETHITRAELLERAGQYMASKALTERLLTDARLTASQRSSCDFVKGLIDWGTGTTDEAIKNFQKAVLHAESAGDLSRLCWAQLRLVVVLCDRTGVAATKQLFSQVRANAIKLGDPAVTAALHIFVGELAAKSGLAHSARRHTELGLRFLSNSPNLWLEAVAENNLAAVAIILCDFHGGIVHAESARRLAVESGAAAMHRAALANLGNLYYLVGDVEHAISLFKESATLLAASGEYSNGALDSLARAYLLQGNADLAQSYLGEIERTIRTSNDLVLYPNRYARLTAAELFMHQRQWQEASGATCDTIALADKAGDQRLGTLARCRHLEVLGRLGAEQECLDLAATVSKSLFGCAPDIYAQYERGMGHVLSNGRRVQVGRAHLVRCERILAGLQNIPGLLELRRVCADIPEVPNATVTESFVDPGRARQAVQDIAALMMQAGRPELVATNLVAILEDTQAVSGAVAIARNEQGHEETLAAFGTPPAKAGSDVPTLPLGTSRQRLIEIRLQPLRDLEAQATLNSITLLLAAVQELERAQAVRDEQLAIWPADELPSEDETSVIDGAMRTLMSYAKRIAQTNISVLITGESGTGKEVLARAIHSHSARAKKPFVPINCTAVPRELLESHLFGHRRGAFTGADRDNQGLIRAAKDGTLFLDEVGELGLDLQPKLLRFLESGEIHPLGETSPFRVDVRIVSATNADIEQLVQEGRFREDLFYRLNVIRLSIPPLRERRDEIPGLVHHFVAQAAKEFGKRRIRVAEETMEHLLLYQWPGNIRQLQNELRRMAALAEPDAVLTPALLAKSIQHGTKHAMRSGSGLELAVPLTEKLNPTLSRIEREMIKVALRASHGRVDAAAKALGISRKGLYLKRQRLGL